MGKRNWIGLKFGMLTVISELDIRSKGRGVMVKCTCDCGNENVIKVASNLHNGTKSCGCLAANNTDQTTHGLSNHPLYSVWNSMKQRCYYIKSKNYSNYGGRGITVCKEWLASFEVFYSFATSAGWEVGLEIDRINNNGNYEPSNVRFITHLKNTRNRRVTTIITYNGETKPLIEWAEQIGISYNTLRRRIQYAKMPLDMAMTNKLLPRRPTIY